MIRDMFHGNKKETASLLKKGQCRPEDIIGSDTSVYRKLIRVDDVMEWLNWPNDRDAMFRSGLTSLAIQVEVEA